MSCSSPRQRSSPSAAATLTIIHGEPTDLAEAEALNEFYAEVTGICDVAEWSRLAGRVDYLTATIAGVYRDK